MNTSPRCASATKIVRPLESTAETQTQLQPDLLRLSAMISQYLRLAFKDGPKHVGKAEGEGGSKTAAEGLRAF